MGDHELAALAWPGASRSGALGGTAETQGKAAHTAHPASDTEADPAPGQQGNSGSQFGPGEPLGWGETRCNR